MNKMTEIIFIINRSGSMNGLESDTIGGYNSFLEQQKQEEGEAMVTTVLFNNRMQVIHDRETIGNVRPLTARDYIPGGSTAAGFSLAFLIIGKRFAPFPFAATVMSLVQALLALALGFSGYQGALAIFSYVAPGLLIDGLSLILKQWIPKHQVY